MVQIKIILDTRTEKSDGTSTIYYRVTEKKKVFYLSTGFSLAARYWDEQKVCVKKTYQNAQTINLSLSKKYFEIQKTIIELVDEELFLIDSLKDKLVPKSSALQLQLATEMSATE